MIALIAHDKKKAELLEFARGHVEFFRHRKLVATGHTGNCHQKSVTVICK